MSLGRQCSSVVRKCLQPCFITPVCSNKLNSNMPSERRFSSTQKLVDVSINEKTGISTVTMQRLPVNSLNLELLGELCSVFDALEKDKSKGMILTSASPTVFSAGLDILEMYKPNRDRLKDFWTTLQDMWVKLFGSSYPTVAAINGHSPAGGCLLALSCEYRIMVGPKFTIGLNETQLGMVAPKWFEFSMEHVISKRQTELALTLGRMFSSEEALKMGLVDELAADKADALAKAEAFLIGMSKLPAMARNMSKVRCRQEPLEWMKQNKEMDLNQFIGLISSPAMQKGLEVYLQALKKK